MSSKRGSFGRKRKHPEMQHSCDHPEGYEFKISNSEKNPGRIYKMCRAAGCFVGWAESTDHEEDQGHRESTVTKKIKPSPQPSRKSDENKSESEQSGGEQNEILELKQLIRLTNKKIDKLFDKLNIGDVILDLN